MRLLLLPAAALLTAAGCAHRPTSTAAVPASDGGAFVVRLGVDTVGVERYARVGNVITADGATRTPTTTVRHWTMTLGDDGRARQFSYEARRAGSPTTRADMTFGAETASVHVVVGPRVATLRIATRDAMPYAQGSYAVLEPLFARARAAGGASYAASVIPVGANQPVALPVTFAGRDSATFSLGGPDLYRARVDARGRVLGLSGAATTQKTEVSRVADVDVAAIAAAWARRDSAGGGFGVPSPTDSVVATAGGATVRVVYSRPALRGRQLMGFLIPYGQVWRTGANAATMFTTSADLVMNGRTIPAGSYTLWTLATPEGAQLIVNRQTGQWGTVYDEKQDLVRVPLSVSTSATPSERFTFSVEPSADGGTLVYVWGDRRFAVPFIVKK